MGKAIPQAICDRLRILCQSHEQQVVAEMLGIQESTITRIKKRGWKAADWSSKIRPKPGDFSYQAGRLKFDDLAKHYGCGNSTLKRWFAECPHARGAQRARQRRLNLRVSK